MSSDARAVLCYGVALSDGWQPWGDADEEDWWLIETGFKRSFELFGEDGNFLPSVVLGKDRDPVDQTLLPRYFQESRDWLAAHPLPFEVVRSGTFDDATYVLALPSSIQKAEWSAPGKIALSKCVVDAVDKIALVNFCAKYDLPTDPDWYLVAFYG